MRKADSLQLAGENYDLWKSDMLSSYFNVKETGQDLALSTLYA
jgi:hypothetical protein